ncbi:MAG: flippase [Dehalococcoidia bacterium]
MESRLPANALVAGDSQIVVRNILMLLLRQGMVWVLSGVLILFLPRYLGAEGLGQLQFARSFAAILAVMATLGAHQFLVKEVARDHSQASHYIGTAIGMRLLASLLVIAAVSAVAQLSGFSVTAATVMYLAAATMVITSLARLLAGFLHGFEDMGGVALADVAGKLTVVVVGTIVLVSMQNVMAYAGVLLMGAVVHLAVAALFLRSRILLRLDFYMPRARTLLKGGVPFLLMAFILEIYNHADVVILRMFTNETTTGWYAAALQFYRAAELFPLAITTALMPTLSRLHLTDVSMLASIAHKSIAVGALVVLPMSLGLSLLSERLIAFLPYPDTFQNSVPLLTLLALTIPATALLTILGTIAIAVDRHKVWAYALLLTLTVDIVLNVLTVPYFDRVAGNGGIGAALTTLLAELVMVAVGVWLMPKGVITWETARLIIKIILGSSVIVAAWLLAIWLNLPVLLLVALGGVGYLAVIFTTRAVTFSDLIFVRRAVSGRLKASSPRNPVEQGEPL